MGRVAWSKITIYTKRSKREKKIKWHSIGFSVNSSSSFFFLHFIFFYHNEYDLVRMMSSKNSSLAITWPSSSQFYSGSTFVYSFFALALVNHYIFFFSLAIFVKIDTLGCNARLSFVQREHHSIQTFTQPLTSPSPTEIGYIVVSHIEIYTFFVCAPLFAFLPLFVKLFLHLSFSFRPFLLLPMLCTARAKLALHSIVELLTVCIYRALCSTLKFNYQKNYVDVSKCWMNVHRHERNKWTEIKKGRKNGKNWSERERKKVMMAQEEFNRKHSENIELCEIKGTSKLKNTSSSSVCVSHFEEDIFAIENILFVPFFSLSSIWQELHRYQLPHCNKSVEFYIGILLQVARFFFSFSSPLSKFSISVCFLHFILFLLEKMYFRRMYGNCWKRRILEGFTLNWIQLNLSI